MDIDKILLNLQYEARPCVLLQLSIYRKLFSLSMTSNISRSQYEELNRDQWTTETAVTHTMESCRLGLCKDLAIETESAINIVVRLNVILLYYMSLCYAGPGVGGK